MMSIDKNSKHGSRIYFCDSLFCRLLRFQHHLLARSSPPLLMAVLDDKEVFEFRLHSEIRNVLLRMLFWFVNLLTWISASSDLQAFIICYHQVT